MSLAQLSLQSTTRPGRREQQESRHKPQQAQPSRIAHRSASGGSEASIEIGRGTRTPLSDQSSYAGTPGLTGGSDSPSTLRLAADARSLTELESNEMEGREYIAEQALSDRDKIDIGSLDRFYGNSYIIRPTISSILSEIAVVRRTTPTQLEETPRPATRDRVNALNNKQYKHRQYSVS